MMDVRWGVLGAGWLVNQATAAAIHHADGAVLYATAARDIDRARATQPQIAYDSYDALINDPDVDAVYICLSNDAHLPWIEASIAAGKHVLCEKPLVLTAEQAERAFALADNAGVHLVEATWSRWHPRMRRIVKLATSGALGEISSFLGTFTFDNMTDGNYRLSPDHGGGALYDVGIYPLHSLIACLPDVTSLDVIQVDRVMSHHGVDVTTTATITWGAESRASIACSFVMPESQRLTIRGSAGEVTVTDNQAFTTWRSASTLRVGDHVEEFPAVDAYQIMFEEISERIRGDNGWLLPPQDSIRVAQTVDALRLHSA
jgi:xylose dehydrogenase (NAD/NADP)